MDKHKEIWVEIPISQEKKEKRKAKQEWWSLKLAERYPWQRLKLWFSFSIEVLVLWGHSAPICGGPQPNHTAPSHLWHFMVSGVFASDTKTRNQIYSKTRSMISLTENVMSWTKSTHTNLKTSETSEASTNFLDVINLLIFRGDCSSCQKH